MSTKITVIPGDGIGQEVIPCAVDVLEAVSNVEIYEAEAGDGVANRTGTPLPDETIELVQRTDATLFGAAGETAADVILPLRQLVDAYVNIRPAKAYPGVKALRPETNVVILRENSEGVYGGHEARLTDDVSILTRVVTETASNRLAQFACDYVRDRDLASFTIAHKANVMQETDGRFLSTVQTVAEQRGLEPEPALMDALATQLCLTPEKYDVIVTPNLAGDVLSDLTAGLVGGLGLLPSANIGPNQGVFEPVHGSAPDIAGEGVANPTAAILSGGLLLSSIGEESAGDRIETAVESVLANGPRTPDLGGQASTTDVRDAVLTALNDH